MARRDQPKESAADTLKAAEAHADRRVATLQEFLAGDDETKERIVLEWIEEEIAKPRTNARVTGLQYL